MSPTVPSGPFEGAEYYNLSFSRENDDQLDVPGKGMMDALRISIGGNEEIGFYFKFRGEPDRILKMLEVVHEAAKQQLPAKRYKDLRT